MMTTFWLIFFLAMGEIMIAFGIYGFRSILGVSWGACLLFLAPIVAGVLEIILVLQLAGVI